MNKVILKTKQPLRTLVAFAVLGLGLASALSLADTPRITGSSKVWSTECASCHLAFPPGLLAARDWQIIMKGLDKHFGSDASMTPAEIKEVSAFLEINASTQEGRHLSTSTPPRLTKTLWFERKHRKVPAQVWSDVKVKSAANCASCHTGADKGNYSDHEVSVPGFVGRRW